MGLHLRPTQPERAREVGIVSTARIRQWHLDLAMLGTATVALAVAVPDAPRPVAAALGVGAWANAMFFLPLAFKPDLDKHPAFLAGGRHVVRGHQHRLQRHGGRCSPGGAGADGGVGPHPHSRPRALTFSTRTRWTRGNRELERPATEPKVRGSNPLGRSWNPLETVGFVFSRCRPPFRARTPLWTLPPGPAPLGHAVHGRIDCASRRPVGDGDGPGSCDGVADRK